MMPDLFRGTNTNFSKIGSGLTLQNSCAKHVPFPARRYIINFCLMFLSAHASAQEGVVDTARSVFQFSGTISFTSKGISPIPAFSLEKPSILGFLSLRKKRFSYDPEMAFSSKGIPWFLNNCFRYRLIDKKRFRFRTGLIWGIGYSYPLVIQNGTSHTIAMAERFLWLELIPKYKISERVSIGSSTFSGYNLETGSAKRINFISLFENLTNIKLHKALYSSFLPQIFYLNIDNVSDGIFVSGLWGIGHIKFPLLLSAQLNQTLSTTISPDPGFKWNLSISYSFK